VILFLAANSRDTGRLALDREARATHVQLKRSGYRDRFDFVTRWGAEPLDLLCELRELGPTIHDDVARPSRSGSTAIWIRLRRGVIDTPSTRDVLRRMAA
jgi:hypothetical protein